MSFILFIFALIFNFIVSHITVRAPKELANQFVNQTIKVGLGNFGNIPYGHKIVGNIYYNLDNEDDTYACTPISLTGIPQNPKVDQSPLLLARRGGNCTFTQKAINIEGALAHAAIIINNEPGQLVEDIIMADDGRGMDIQIPSVLITKEDGDKLINYYKAHHDEKNKIVLEIDFDIEHKNNSVNYTIWYTPDQESAYTLMNDLYVYQKELGELAMLQVHFLTYTHFSYKEGEMKAVENCLGSGKYCMRTEEAKIGTSNGRDILKETIKQICVYNFAYQSTNYDLFWKYISNFYTNCILENKFTSSCSIYQTKLSGLPVDYINKCVNDSYYVNEGENKKEGYENLVGNTLLDKEYEARKKNMIYRAPSLYINNRLFLGSWRADYVFEGICAAFSKKPEICYTDGGFEKERQTSVITVVLIVLGILILNVVIFVMCMKVIKKKIQERLDGSDINRKIDTIVNSYLQMRDTK